MRRTGALIAIAALAGSLVLATSRTSVATAAEATCRDQPGANLVGGNLDGSTPIVLVHGFTGNDLTWHAPIDQAIDTDVQVHGRSFVEQLLRIDGVSVWTFDYHDKSARWVTDPSIGPALADLLDCLGEHGARPAVVVGHSMGGLAARYAFSLMSNPAAVSGLVTFGTPHLGSDVAAWLAGGLDHAELSVAGANGVAGLVWSNLRGDLEDCWDAATASVETAACGVLPPLWSEAGDALRRGSTAVNSLPPVPDHVAMLGVAGNIEIYAQQGFGFFYADLARVSLGDLLVMVDSGTAQSDEVEVLTCRLNFKIGYSLSEGFLELTGFDYDDGTERSVWELFSNPCYHSNLTKTVEFTNRALSYINSIAELQQMPGSTLPETDVASLIGCAGPCQVTGVTPVQHPTWGPVTLATYLSKGECDAGIVAIDQSMSIVWDWPFPEFCPLELLQPVGLRVPLFLRPEEVPGSASDSLGHVFIDYNPGRYNASIILKPAPGGFEDFGTLPSEGDWVGRFYFTAVTDTDSDGIYELANYVDAYDRAGELSRFYWRWNGSDYVPEVQPPAVLDWERELFHYSYAEIHEVVTAGDWGWFDDVASLLSGCSPGTPDSLPDGIWVGTVESWSSTDVQFDLYCAEVETQAATVTITAVTNTNSQLRTIPISPSAIGYPWRNGYLDGQLPVLDTLETISRGQLTILTINGGAITELAEYPSGASTTMHSYLQDGAITGCSPGTPDTLPDGVWYGFVKAADSLQVAFDLACSEWVLSEDGSPKVEVVTNNNPALRQLPISPSAVIKDLTFGGEPHLAPGIKVRHMLAALEKLRADIGVEWPVIVSVNGGLVTEMVLPFRS